MRLLPAALSLAISMAFVQNAAAENILEIYQDAVNNDLVMRAAKAELRAGQEEANIALGALLPQIGAGASYSDSESTNENPNNANTGVLDSSSVSTSWSIGLQQSLFDMGKWYTFKSSQKLSEQAEISFRQNQQSLIVRTTTAYLDVLRAHNNLESSIAEEKAVKQQLDQTQQRFDVGLVAITDVHESRAIYDLAQVSRLTYEGVLETSYEGLTVLTGRMYTNIQPLLKNIPITLPNPAERSAWQELAIQGNLDLRKARLASQAAELGAKAAASLHLPTVTASISHNESSLDEGTQFGQDLSGMETTGDSISINLQIPIFSGGTISANRRKSYAQFDQARETLGAAERGITQQIRAAHIAVLTSIQEVAARKQSITSAQSAVDAIQAGYNYGTRNIVDVLNAQRNLFSAQRDHANARYDYILRLLELKQAAGVLTPADIQGLNQWISNSMNSKTNPALLPASSRMKVSS
mgnify:CR=1 FL=1